MIEKCGLWGSHMTSFVKTVTLCIEMIE